MVEWRSGGVFSLLATGYWLLATGSLGVHLVLRLFRAVAGACIMALFVLGSVDICATHLSGFRVHCQINYERLGLLGGDCQIPDIGRGFDNPLRAVNQQNFPDSALVDKN